MKNKLFLVALLIGASVPALSQAQSRYGHRKTPAKTVAHLHHGSHQLHHDAHHSGCGCGHRVDPCCPQLIPAILDGLGRALDCLLPCHRCDTGCATKGPSCGCGAPGHIVSEPTSIPKPTPDKTGYRHARDSHAARAARTRRSTALRPYHPSSARRVPTRYQSSRQQPTPVKQAPRKAPVKSYRTVSQATPFRTASHKTNTKPRPRSTGIDFRVPVNPLR